MEDYVRLSDASSPNVSRALAASLERAEQHNWPSYGLNKQTPPEDSEESEDEDLYPSKQLEGWWNRLTRTTPISPQSGYLTLVPLSGDWAWMTTLFIKTCYTDFQAQVGNNRHIQHLNSASSQGTHMTTAFLGSLNSLSELTLHNLLPERFESPHAFEQQQGRQFQLLRCWAPVTILTTHTKFAQHHHKVLHKQAAVSPSIGYLEYRRPDRR